MPGVPPFVLVLDDYPDAAESARDLLTLCGFRVRTARTCAEACAACTEPPAAVVADARLLDRVGCKLTERWRVVGCPMPAIIAIGDVRHPRCDGPDHDHYFLKPANPRELVTLLRRYVPAPAGDAPLTPA